MANESEWSTWKNHAVFQVDLLGKGFSDGVDKFLGVVLFLCGVIGFPANVVSFIYFIKRITTNISLKLYSVISLTDCITCILIIADAKVLFEKRDPGGLGIFTSANSGRSVMRFPANIPFSLS